MKNKFRVATLLDTKKIITLNKRYFHEKDRDWESFISGQTSEMFVLQRGSEIIGFSGLLFHDWNKSARVIDIFIHPAYRHQGLATVMMKYLLRRARRRKIRVVIVEAPSQNIVLLLYLKCGFRICGYNDRYYSNHGKEAAIFLSFELR